MSARAAGFEIWATDLFADSDLRALGPVEQVTEYPQGLLRALQSAPAGPWMYTGAIENYPDLIDDMAAVRPLYGNPSRVVRQIRDPQVWSSVLETSGFSVPRITFHAAEIATDGTWLIKPLRSAGGHNVRVWDQAAADEHTHRTAKRQLEFFFQQRINGQPISAVFVASEGEVVLLGVTRQLLSGDIRRDSDAWHSDVATDAGTPQRAFPTDSDATPRSAFPTEAFRYAGSIGPLAIDDTFYRRLQEIGAVLSRQFKLIGLFGVDAILTPGDVYPVEINPRYTASIEVLERASALRTSDRRAHRLLAIEWHEAACCYRSLPDPISQSTSACAGKLIVYASCSFTISDTAVRWAILQSLGQARPRVADIPLGGTAIQAGHPILTLLADGNDEAIVLAELQRLENELRDVLGRGAS